MLNSLAIVPIQIEIYKLNKETRSEANANPLDNNCEDLAVPSLCLLCNFLFLLTDENYYHHLVEFNVNFVNVIFILMILYATVKVFFANVKRGGILLTLIGVGSLYMLNLPRGYSDGFNGWIKQVIALCFTSFMQTTLFFTGLITIQSDWLIGTCLILSATEVPRIADRFGLDTSIRGNMMAVSMTANTALSGMRFIRAVAK